MTTYQLRLLLEALIRVHSYEELADGEPVISLLVRHLGFSPDEAEAVVEGALNLKTVRAGCGTSPTGEIYLQ